jgi:aldose 1-epimerase
MGNNLSGLSRKAFQKTVDGKETDLFFLRNNKIEIAVTNYGAAVVAIMVPDKNDTYGNVVLGHDTIDSVIDSPEQYLSTTIGRYGNRIKDGKFTLNGKDYTLAVNNGPNALHGGPTGFHRRVWDARQKNESAVEFRYTAADGEEGFPGKLEVLMTYTLTEYNEWIISYKATTDKTTIVNLTNHAFFNLAGITEDSPTCMNNLLTFHADHYIPINDVCIPLGEVAKVEGTPLDFRTPHIVGDRIDADHIQMKNGAGYDHCFVLNKKEAGELTLAAKCVEPNSRRFLEVYTTEPGVQLYSGNWLNGFAGYKGATFPRRSALCFEAQKFPDTPNRPYFPSCVLKPGGEYKQVTVYKFGVE